MKYANKINMVSIVIIFIIANACSYNSRNSETVLTDNDSINTSYNDTCVMMDVNPYLTPFIREIDINELKLNPNLDSIEIEYKQNVHNDTVVDTIFKFYIKGDIFVFSENITKPILLGSEIRHDILNLLAPKLKIGEDYDNSFNALNHGTNCIYLKFIQTETGSFFIVSFSNKKIVKINYFPYFD